MAIGHIRHVCQLLAFGQFMQVYPALICHEIVGLARDTASISHGQGEEGATKRDSGPGVVIARSTVADRAAIIGALVIAVIEVAELGDTACETIEAVIGNCSVYTANVLGCGVVSEVLDPERVVIQLAKTSV